MYQIDNQGLLYLGPVIDERDSFNNANIDVIFDLDDDLDIEIPDCKETVLEPISLTDDYIAQLHSKMSMFVNLFFGILDPETGVLTYINAGHNPPVLLDATGHVKEHLTLTGLAVGLMPDINYLSRQSKIEPGDTLFLFTDGVPESHNPEGKLFTEKRMLEILPNPVPSTDVLLKNIVDEVNIFMSTANPFDDITMLAIRRGQDGRLD